MVFVNLSHTKPLIMNTLVHFSEIIKITLDNEGVTVIIKYTLYNDIYTCT